MIDLPGAIRSLIESQDLSGAEMEEVMTIIMQGEATPAQIGAFLIALRIKGEVVEELAAAARVVRKFAAKVSVRSQNIVDTVGTGGDGAGLFNVSTAAALVASAAGVVIAKHGNRAVTGKSGSADLLEAGGVNIELAPDQVSQTIDAVGIGYMFAPAHHGAFRYLVGPRREIGVRTMFNLLGPLTNPADAKFQLVGVFSRDWVRPIAEVFKNLGSIHTLVVHSQDGLDEISIAAPTDVSELFNGVVSDYVIYPEEFGFTVQSLETLRVDSVEASFELIQRAFRGEKGPAYNMVALNAGATIYTANRASSLKEGVTMACSVLDCGDALKKLKELADFTAQFRINPS
jgi:anthranilate phosphoribosyltransferase